MAETQNTAQEFAVLRGGKEITVEYEPVSQEELDKAPRRDTVLVKKVSLRDMAKLGTLWADDFPLIAFLTGKDEKWVDSLTMDSQLAVLEIGRELNFTHFQRWFADQTKILDAMGQVPLVQKAIQDALKQLDSQKSQQRAVDAEKQKNKPS